MLTQRSQPSENNVQRSIEVHDLLSRLLAIGLQPGYYGCVELRCMIQDGELQTSESLQRKLEKH